MTGMADPDGARFISAAIPPICGQLRAVPEDFVVEEVLAYEPCGIGTHTFIKLRKTGLTTNEAVRRLARALARREDEFGFAGFKDRQAVTTQTVSIEHADSTALEQLDIAGIEVLALAKHGNKLKTGHLHGNRFRIRVRNAHEEDTARAQAVLDLLEKRGLPNYFGEQRFGRQGITPELGRMLLAEDMEGFMRALVLSALPADVDVNAAPAAWLEQLPRSESFVRRPLETWAKNANAARALRVLPRRFLRLCTSALQSVLFNAVLSARLESFDQLLMGDLAFLHKNGAVFLVEDPAIEAPRAASFELSPSGALPGPDSVSPQGRQLELETQALLDFDVDPSLFGCHRPWAQKGGRRPLRVPVQGCALSPRPAQSGNGIDLELTFSLPRGSYATAVLSELFKTALP